MFSGGDYQEVARWLAVFVNSHAKRESPRVEGVVGRREGVSYGVRVRLGSRYAPRLDAPAVTLGFREVADGRGRLDWCTALAARVRELAREVGDLERGSKQSA